MRKTLVTVAAALGILGVSVAGGIYGADVLRNLTETPKQMPTVHVTIPADVPEKPGVPYYIIEYGDKSVVNIEPPAELHVAHTPNEAACKEMGGTYQARNQMCLDVDY